MSTNEPKKLALLRVLQILEKCSDRKHPLTQDEILKELSDRYGIVLERKAVGYNIACLREAGYEIVTNRAGSYLDTRTFEDAELRMLIDGVLCSRYISAKYSEDLIRKLSDLLSVSSRSRVKNIRSVKDRNKSENAELFLTIESVDRAIERKKKVQFDYCKPGIDRKLHKSSAQCVSPYQMIVQNQRYYLMAYNEKWEHMSYYRMDYIKNMKITDLPAVPLRSVPGFENGFDYKELIASMPYMYSDKPEVIVLRADAEILDQIVDWFGSAARIREDENDEKKLRVTVKASPRAMEYWAAQYLNHVEVLAPESLREKIRQNLAAAMKKYE